MKLHYKQYGDSGESIFVLHGLFGMLDNWHIIARELGKQYKVFTLDARNHGQSPHSDEMSYKLMAEDVVELADDLHISQFILMGHSMGGKTAMTCALMYPDRILKLLVVDIAPKAYAASHDIYFEAFETIHWSVLQTRKEVDEALAVYEPDPGIRLFLAKNVERGENGGFTLKCNIRAIHDAYDEISGNFVLKGVYTGATLFAAGANSRYFEEADKAHVLAHFPNAAFIKIQDAGHWVHADNPDGFIESVNEFLH